jgi:hypothetical protein
MFEFRFSPAGPVLDEYMSSRSRNTFIMGPMGSGKTFASCMRMFTQICSQPVDQFNKRRSRWVAVRNTYPDLEGTTMKDWLELFGAPELGKMNRDYPPTHKLSFAMEDNTYVEAEVVFLALDRPDSVRKLRGMQCTGFWLNEVKELDEEIVDMCDLRHGRYPNKHEVPGYWHGMIGDTNAPDDNHWYYKKAEIDRPKGWVFLKQPGGLLQIDTPTGKQWVLNPRAENLQNLPEDYYTAGMQGKKEAWIKVNLANMYGHLSSGKPIYEHDWNDTTHVSQYPLVPLPEKGNFFMGWDFGMTPSVIIGQLDGPQMRILDEVVGENIGIRSFARDYVIPYLRQQYKGVSLKSFRCMCDPSGDDPRDTEGGSPIEILNELGFEAEPSPTNHPETRWEAVRYFLSRLVGGRPCFVLSPNCDTLRKGFNGGYQFKRMQVSGQARYSEKADKNSFSHPHDALQYLCQAAWGGYNPMNTGPKVHVSNQRVTGKAGY